jgi:endonuclease/exonuclease/phosphatase family metal-dependent hydrolase
VAGLIGQVIRDRSVLMGILMYLPLLPMGLAALVLDLARSGRALPRSRFALTLLGAVGIGCSATPMFGSGRAGSAYSGEEEVALLQWNVQWGGGWARSWRTWAAQRSEILQRRPDLVILSEAPPDDWLDLLVSDLGPDSTCVRVAHDPGSRYWFRLAVCSRWPIHLEERVPLPGGAGMSVLARVHGRPLRLLVVDGLSNPCRSRTPFLHAVADACRAAEASGRPFDAVAGDFNSPGRSIGFDPLAAQGYRLASWFSVGWRGTFPAPLPLYDIDHVWLGARLRVRSCTLFNGPYTDHRGQLVRVGPVGKP